MGCFFEGEDIVPTTGQHTTGASPIALAERTPRVSVRHSTPPSAMRRIWRNNGLSIALFLMFVLALAGQSVTGYLEHNDDQRDHNRPTVTFGAYLRSPHFLEATAENWESEFLQMAAYVLLTVFLFQKGSAESKDPDDPTDEVDREPDPQRTNCPSVVRRGGFLLLLYKHSLLIAFFALFLVSFGLHAIGGAREYNEERIAHATGGPLSALAYMGTSRFWFESLQNWQSEFLAVLSIVVLTIFLRQKGSPESKPVDAPHFQTASD